MKYIVTIKYMDFEFEDAEEAIAFARTAKENFVSTKYDAEIAVTITIANEKDKAEEEDE